MTVDRAHSGSVEARTNPFRHKPRFVPLAPAEAVRQGAISALAFQLLGRDAALAFLNHENETLKGRPIAIATESEAGFESVERELRLRSQLKERQHEE